MQYIVALYESLDTILVECRVRLSRGERNHATADTDTVFAEYLVNFLRVAFQDIRFHGLSPLRLQL